jgi:cellulose synthase/poly-beta-1,6-N-acetylglucosamine synthase-like glycosyltransferase
VTALLHALSRFAQGGILVYFLLMNGLTLLFILRSFILTKRYLDEVETDPLEAFFESPHYKPITLLCPVYNEAAGVVASISSLLALRYPEFQVVVVNDGSKDDTVQRLVEAFKLHPSRRVIRQLLPTKPIRGVYESAYVPNLVLVDKENGGKSDALNCGINLARYPLVCCMDGDSLLEYDSLLRVSRPFLDRPQVVASTGVIRPLNGCTLTPSGIRGIHLPTGWLPRFQIVEYLRAFLFGRMGLASFQSLFIVSGAFGVFRRDLLLELGGFSTATIGEDLECVVRLHRHLRDKGQAYEVVLVPDPVCWTEVPEDIGTLRRQRNRWQRGLMDSLWIHRRMWFNPKYGRIGLFSMPYFLIFEALAPLIELGGYIAFAYFVLSGQLNAPFALLFLVLAILLGLLNSIASVILEQLCAHPYQGLKEWLLLLLTGLLENFGYRQRTLVWRLRGIWDWLRGKEGWGHMVRKGIPSAPPPPGPQVPPAP